ncbi:MAG: PAS domain S-box protein, partial [Oxalobacteraceae bacterium]
AAVYQSVMAVAQEAVVIVDAAGRIQQWGGSAEVIFGYTPEEMRGQPFADLLTVSPMAHYAAGGSALDDAKVNGLTVGARIMAHLLEQPAGLHPRREEAFGRRRDGSTCSLEVSTTRFEVGNKRSSCWVLRDISARRQSEQERDTQFRASMVLAALHSLQEAGPKLLQIMCMGLGWDLGSFWVEDAVYGRLVCSGSWSRDMLAVKEDTAPLAESCIVSDRVTSENLLNDTWTSGEPTWIPDITGHDVASMQIPLNTRYRSVCYIPLLSINECYGVLELAATEVKPCIRDTLCCLQQIANQTGQFLRRHNIEQSMRASEQRFRSLFTSTAVSMALLSSTGIMEAVNQALCTMLG